MENSEQISDWTTQAIIHWIRNGIKLQEGFSADRLHEVEKTLGFTFPQGFVELYKKVNGFEDYDWNEHMFSLWSLDRILKEYQEDADINYIGFCDFLLNSHSLGFYKDDGRIYKNYNEGDPIANSFRDFIVLLNSNADLLY